MKKTITKIAIIAIVSALVVGNLYAFGWKKIEQKLYSRGVGDAINTVINQIQQTGQVIIDTPDGQVILVPK